MLVGVHNVWDDNSSKPLLCHRLFTSGRIRLVNSVKSEELVTSFGLDCEGECGI